MVMIRCPDCGQRVLDIATSCPKCHRVLIQNPLETHNWGALRACGRCHKHIERDAVLCPYCGHRVRAARLAGRAVAAVAGIAVLVAAGVAAWRLGVDSIRGTLGAARRVSRAPASVVVTASPQLSADSADVVVAPITASVSRDSGAAPEREGPGRAAAPAATAAPPAGLVRRWTAEWANVRAGRDVASAVVRVLAPNVPVDVGDIRQGWWALYADGALVGYIANSVLRIEPNTL